MRVCILDDDWDTVSAGLQNRIKSIIRTVDPRTDSERDVRGFVRPQDFLDHLYGAQESGRLPDLLIIDENLGGDIPGSMIYDEQVAKEFKGIPAFLFTRNPELRSSAARMAAKHHLCEFEMKDVVLANPSWFVDIIRKLLSHARCAPASAEAEILERGPLRLDMAQQRLFVRGREVREALVPVQAKDPRGTAGRKRVVFQGRLAKLLEQLMTAKSIVTRSMILDNFDDTLNLERTDEQLRQADQYILHLRDLLKASGCPDMIETLPRQGWRLTKGASAPLRVPGRCGTAKSDRSRPRPRREARRR